MRLLGCTTLLWFKWLFVDLTKKTNRNCYLYKRHIFIWVHASGKLILIATLKQYGLITIKSWGKWKIIIPTRLKFHGVIVDEPDRWRSDIIKPSAYFTEETLFLWCYFIVVKSILRKAHIIKLNKLPLRNRPITLDLQQDNMNEPQWAKYSYSIY